MWAQQLPTAFQKEKWVYKAFLGTKWLKDFHKHLSTRSLINLAIARYQNLAFCFGVYRFQQWCKSGPFIKVTVVMLVNQNDKSWRVFFHFGGLFLPESCIPCALKRTCFLTTKHLFRFMQIDTCVCSTRKSEINQEKSGFVFQMVCRAQIIYASSSSGYIEALFLLAQTNFLNAEIKSLFLAIPKSFSFACAASGDPPSWKTDCRRHTFSISFLLPCTAFIHVP